MRKPLTREQDKALWVDTRLKAAYDEGRCRTVYAMSGLTRKLQVAYERLNPVHHEAPANHHAYGQRLSERALALHAR